MAINDAAADAACNAWLDTFEPQKAEQRTIQFTALAPLFRAIYSGIRTNAVVNPATGSPPMSAGGDAVTGNAKVE